jgi:hypothetical protein
MVVDQSTENVKTVSAHSKEAWNQSRRINDSGHIRRDRSLRLRNWISQGGGEEVNSYCLGLRVCIHLIHQPAGGRPWAQDSYPL